MSHTGALSSDQRVVDAAFRQAGVIRANNPDEMLYLAQCLAECPRPRGKRIAILSEGGGDNAIAADYAAEFELEVPIFSERVQKDLEVFLLEGMTAQNPVDYGGTAEENPATIPECVKVCMQSGEIDMVCITGFFGGFQNFISASLKKQEITAAEELAKAVSECGKPLFVHSSFAKISSPALEYLKQAGIPVLESSEQAIKCASVLSDYSASQKRLEDWTPFGVDGERPAGAAAILKQAAAEKQDALLETDSRRILEEYSLPVVPAVLAAKSKQALRAARKFGYPVALKIVHPELIHKSDLGGVRLNLNSRKEVRSAFKDICRLSAGLACSESMKGVLVAPMRTEGQECILGVVRNPEFGPVFLFGLGGIYVELIKDVSIAVFPLSLKEFDQLIHSTQAGKLLRGVRGSTGKDIAALKQVMETLYRLVLENPEIKAIELNPLLVEEKGAVILDSRIILAQGRLQ